MDPAARPEIESAEDFYHRTFRRLVLTMAALALLGTPAIWIRWHASQALGFLAGSIVAIVNFYWLRRTVEALGNVFDATGRKPSSARVVARFLLRYVLIALAAYVIFRGSAASLYGLIAGLSLPVGAILIEAVYETYRALRAGL
ncbi:MAG TPA: ATP synthase subunit I [Candidatus Limnocylindrales bacterium]|nr:ATP synthase subunit I [Candidatus Limnocylindrales bacterium]